MSEMASELKCFAFICESFFNFVAIIHQIWLFFEKAMILYKVAILKSISKWKFFDFCFHSIPEQMRIFGNKNLPAGNCVEMDENQFPTF